MAWQVEWRVIVDGRDATASMRPFLIDISVTDKDGTASDTCSLTFDDTDGRALLPRDGAKLSVYLQGGLAFSGTVDSSRSTGSRGGGRLLTVSAKGMDSRGKAKEPQHFHRDNGTLREFLEKAASNAGLAGIRIDEELASVSRNYWAADGESFVHLGQRLARELGATFKIRAGKEGDVAVLALRGKDKGLPTIVGMVGRNVISWDIAPYTGRRAFTKARVQWFDRKAAAYKSKEVEFDLDRQLPEAVNAIRSSVADEDQAAIVGEARKREAEREGGEGTVEIDLAVEAQAEGTFVLAGARPGVDGEYRIASVTHRASRSGGSTTTLEVKQPGGEAGKDTRKPSDSSARAVGQGAPEPEPQDNGQGFRTGSGLLGSI
jgi:uncharacterized protein